MADLFNKSGETPAPEGAQAPAHSSDKALGELIKQIRVQLDNKTNGPADAVQSMLEAGHLIVRLRGIAGRGGKYHRSLEQVGVKPAWANQVVRAATKVQEANLSAEAMERLTRLGRWRVGMLGRLEAEELSELFESGEFENLRVQDLMSFKKVEHLRPVLSDAIETRRAKAVVIPENAGGLPKGQSASDESQTGAEGSGEVVGKADYLRSDVVNGEHVHLLSFRGAAWMRLTDVTKILGLGFDKGEVHRLLSRYKLEGDEFTVMAMTSGFPHPVRLLSPRGVELLAECVALYARLPQRETAGRLVLRWLKLGGMAMNPETATERKIEPSDRDASRLNIEPPISPEPAAAAVKASIHDLNEARLGPAGDEGADLAPGDRVRSAFAARPGRVVKVYGDSSCSVAWDDGSPQPEGLGNERLPRHLLVRVDELAAPAGATLGKRRFYGLELLKLILRYATDSEVDDLVQAIEDEAREIAERRYAPGLQAARYDLHARFWLGREGSK
ncbi:MAG: hypothetical protein KDH15_13895 [Rhodocyclaceae bacterium]|nr:hypothetical protein [Rhodocyclaceae bacterium]